MHNLLFRWKNQLHKEQRIDWFWLLIHPPTTQVIQNGHISCFYVNEKSFDTPIKIKQKYFMQLMQLFNI